MAKIIKQNITAGVIWLEISDADLYMCCGCPADVVKHLKRAGLITTVMRDDGPFENGPNAILLSDTLIQNGKLANLSEFVILQMLYLQGCIVPGHPNYKKYKPIVIGYEEQLARQLSYVAVGNHGLEDVNEIIEAGFTLEKAKKVFATKLHYAGGDIKKIEELVEARSLENEPIEIKKGVFIRRSGVNKFEVHYKGEHVEIDLTLASHEQYAAPYDLPYSLLKPSYFSITHTGEGNGWDVHRPCMSSVVHFKGRNYLIDAGPNVLNNLERLGLGLSEIDGIFLTHNHDDHFAGITDLLNVERKLTLFCTGLIRKTAEKKLSALFHSKIDLMRIAFNYVELLFDEWNEIDGLEVMPTYSPHTVETSVFRFRARHDGEEKTYLHLADTINFKEFEIIVNKSPEIFSQKDRDYVMDSYLATVNLKKLDVGGGAIHGHLSDYVDDRSDKLVMAHTTEEVAHADPRFVNAQFGDTDHLIIDGNYEFFNVRILGYLRHYFRKLPIEELASLARAEIMVFEPGEEIPLEQNKNIIYLVVSGLIEYANELGVRQRVDAGNFIGYSKRYFSHVGRRTYRALSFVRCLTISESGMDSVFAEHDLLQKFYARQQLINTLRDSYLVQYSLSGSTFYSLSGESELIEIPDGKFTDEDLTGKLFILMEGSVTVRFEDKFSIEIFKHQHFGGLNLLHEYRRAQRFIFSNKIKAMSVPVEKLKEVPVLLWRLIELEEMRYQLSIFETK
jgi:hemerythrin